MSDPFSDSVTRFQGPAGPSPGAQIDVLATGGNGLNSPRGLTFDSVGDLHIVSTGSDEVLRYSSGPTVSLSSPSSQTVTVDYATVDGSATESGDYTAASGTLTFAPGETTNKSFLRQLMMSRSKAMRRSLST